MQGKRAVEPQVFTDTPDLVPVAPGERWRLNFRQQVGRAVQIGDFSRIGWRQLGL